MSEIKFSTQQKTTIVAKIQQYFDRELDQGEGVKEANTWSFLYP